MEEILNKKKTSKDVHNTIYTVLSTVFANILHYVTAWVEKQPIFYTELQFISIFSLVAYNKKATQSSTHDDFHASAALNDRGNCHSWGFSHTRNEREPWLQIDLGSEHRIQRVEAQVRSKVIVRY